MDPVLVLMVLLYSTWNQINQGTWPSSCISNELQAIGTKLKFSNTLFTKWTQHKVCIINAMIPKIYGGAAVTAQTCPLFTTDLYGSATANALFSMIEKDTVKSVIC